MINRRGFLNRASSLAAAAVAFPNVSHAADKTISGKPGQKPRRIIHMVSDGMSVGTLTCAEHFSRIVRGRGTAWISLYSHPAARVGLMNTRSLNSLVTDSSAASSAWGSGTRIINGVVNQAGDGTPLRHLYEILGDARWKRGLVTTTEITHATPAGFASWSPAGTRPPKLPGNTFGAGSTCFSEAARSFLTRPTASTSAICSGSFATPVMP
jgi:alkaline phosphatase